jgi:hypothetical protein
VNALQALAEQLREEETPISPHVVEPTASAAHELTVEAIREGYLLHYGEPRLLAGHDPDLALLAGDYLYALGLERLAQLGDIEAVAVLADLISRCAQCHTEGREAEVPELWRSAAAAVAGTA